MKDLKTAVQRFKSYKRNTEDKNTAYLYELVLEEIIAIIGNIKLEEYDRVTYCILVSQLQENSMGDTEISSINISILDEFSDWMYDRKIIECDVSKLYNILLN